MTKKKSTVNENANGEIPISRRSWLKTLGVGTSVITFGSGTATSTSDGYGEGGYGEGGYGDSTDSLTVTTDGASDVGETSVTLDGSLTDLGGASSADVFFEYRKTGVSTWSTTATQTLSSTGSFSASLPGLSDGVDYEFRAVASASDGDTDTGSTNNFTTIEHSVVVSTDSTTDIGETTATLNGAVTDLGNANSADVSFEYRDASVSNWTSTSVQTLSSTGSFSVSISGFVDGVDYEFRAVASASDGDSDTGSITGFTTVEPTVNVWTDKATDVGGTSATLNGSVTDLGNASSAEVSFEYRETESSSWTTTSTQSLSSTGSFSETVTSLTSGTDYEFRAVALASDGDTDTGSSVTFTTTTIANDPVIERFSVSEAGSPNPHAEITVVWDVADADGDLASVEIDVSDSDGTVQNVTWTLSGTTASDTDSFKIKHGGGKVYDVTLRVQDSAGNAVSDTKSVSS